MEFTRIKALWRENKGFHLVRQSTGDEYIFIHLLSPVRVMLGGEWTEAREGACILYDKNAYQELIAEERPLLHDYFHLTGNISELMERLGLSFSTIYYPQNTEAVTAIIQQGKASGIAGFSCPLGKMRDVCLCGGQHHLSPFYQAEKRYS